MSARREEVAGVLHDMFTGSADCWPDCFDRDWYLEEADALLPLIEAREKAAAARALREAADARPEWQAVLNREDDRHFATGSMHGAGPDVACDVFEDMLRARADRIDGKQ